MQHRHSSSSNSGSSSGGSNRASDLQDRLHHERSYWRCKSRMKEELLGPGADGSLSSSSSLSLSASKEEMKQRIQHLLFTTSVGSELKSAVARLHDMDRSAAAAAGIAADDGRPPVAPLPDDSEYIWSARVEWEKRLRYELRAVGSKQSRALIQLRDPPINPATSEQDTAAADAEFAVRFVYTAEDLLEVLAALKNPHRRDEAASASASTGKPGAAAAAAVPPRPSMQWGLLDHLCLPVPSLSSLSERFASLAPEVRQVGLDDEVLGGEWFAAERMRVGEELLAAPPTPAALAAIKAYARTGIPSALRPAMWARLLGVPLPLSPALQSRYTLLRARVDRWRLLTDDLLRFDAEDGPGDDAEFFVFAELLQEVVLVFSRDEEVRTLTSLLTNSAPLEAKPSRELRQRVKDEAAAIQAATAAAAAAQPRSKAANAVASQPPLDPSSLLLDAVPPNRVVPHHRLMYLLSPFAFLFSRGPELYFVFRSFYCRWLCRLAIVSSRPDSILPLSARFEALVQSRCPSLCFHLLRLGVTPLQCGAFSWLCSAFSGVLPVDQVLLLWDRILSFESFDVLAVLAAAIFQFREAQLSQCSSAAQVHRCLGEMASIRVMPLMQHFLFGARTAATTTANGAPGGQAVGGKKQQAG